MIMLRPYQRYTDFKGRSSRSEYWLFVLFTLVVEAALMFLSSVAPSLAGLLLLSFMLGSLVPSLAVAVRRMHDSDRSGWHLLLGIFPFFGGIYLIILCCLPGTPGPNAYGPEDGEQDYAAIFAD